MRGKTGRILSVLLLSAILAGCGAEGKEEKMSDTVDESARETERQPVIRTGDIRELEPERDYTALGNELFRFEPADPVYRIVQGGYFDGERWYIAMLNNSDPDGWEKVKIQVMDSKGTLLRVSEPLSIDHANNLTYLPDEGVLFSSNCQSPDKHYAVYSKIDPVSLTVTESGELPYPFFSMAYSPEKEMFASGEWAGQTLDIWNRNLELVMRRDVECPASTSQGVFCDANAIYFVRSGNGKARSEIRIYDWSLNLVRVLPVALGGDYEPENINIVGGKTYIVSNNLTWTGGIVFDVTYQDNRAH